jgi:hypothetical protein
MTLSFYEQRFNPCAGGNLNRCALILSLWTPSLKFQFSSSWRTDANYPAKLPDDCVFLLFNKHLLAGGYPLSGPRACSRLLTLQNR